MKQKNLIIIVAVLLVLFAGTILVKKETKSVPTVATPTVTTVQSASDLNTVNSDLDTTDLDQIDSQLSGIDTDSSGF